MDPVTEFQVQLRNFDNEVRNAVRYLYADLAIQHAASQSQRLLHRLNDTPTFWLTTAAALQTAAYISIGRIFDKDSRYTLEKLLAVAESNLIIFQREALENRKMDGHSTQPEWLAEYLNNAYYPSMSDFSRLRKRVEIYRRLYLKMVRPARNKYIAHREKVSHEDVADLFRRGTIKELSRLVIFLQQVERVLWELLQNGRKPAFRSMRHELSVIYDQPSREGAHEQIVGEVKKLMSFIENAKIV